MKTPKSNSVSHRITIDIEENKFGEGLGRKAISDELETGSRDRSKMELNKKGTMAEEAEVGSIVDKKEVQFLNYRVRTMVRTFENELRNIFFRSKIIYMDDFIRKLQNIFEGR
jgi:hypothetical protein